MKEVLVTRINPTTGYPYSEFLVFQDLDAAYRWANKENETDLMVTCIEEISTMQIEEEFYQ